MVVRVSWSLLYDTMEVSRACPIRPAAIRCFGRTEDGNESKLFPLYCYLYCQLQPESLCNVLASDVPRGASSTPSLSSPRRPRRFEREYRAIRQATSDAPDQGRRPGSQLRPSYASAKHRDPPSLPSKWQGQGRTENGGILARYTPRPDYVGRAFGTMTITPTPAANGRV